MRVRTGVNARARTFRTGISYRLRVRRARRDAGWRDHGQTASGARSQRVCRRVTGTDVARAQRGRTGQVARRYAVRGMGRRTGEEVPDPPGFRGLSGLVG